MSEILTWWQYHYESGVNLNKAHVFALEMSAETGVTLNPQEWHGDLISNKPHKQANSWTNRVLIETIGRELKAWQ